MTKLGAGVIGLGVGRHHCAGYATSEHAELKAVCDLIPERLTTAKREYGVDTYDDLDAFLARDDISIVSVCTPDYMHLEAMRKAVPAGKHILLEKPIAINYADAVEVAKLAASTDKTIGIEYEFRLNPTVLALKQAVDSGELGDVAAVSMYDWRGAFGRAKWGKWIQSESKSGGMVVEEVCHWFDLMHLLGGEIDEVHCVWHDQIHKDFDFEDVAFINCRFASGAAGHIAHNLAGWGHLFDIWLIGTDASARVFQKERIKNDFGVGDGEFFGRFAMRKHLKPCDFDEAGKPRPDEHETHPVVTKTFGEDATEPQNIMAMCRQFARSVVTGEPVVATVEDGIKSLVAALAARQSAKEKRPVCCAEIVAGG